MSSQHNEHIPVLLNKAVQYLSIQPNRWYIDCTFGRGGHTAALLQKGGKVLALDWDEEAITAGSIKFQSEIAAGNLILIRESFSKLASIIEQLPTQTYHGILFDFGTSTNQLMADDRGFSFTSTSELDMRMDTRLGVKAKDILTVIPENQLATLFWEYGGEEDARKIAKAIKNPHHPIVTAQDLSQLVERVKHGRSGKLHPATKVFQALRIAVNSELEEITQALPQALSALTEGGKIVAISFHEGEDRIVKTVFKKWESEKLGSVTTDKPVTPSPEEIEANPRSRSAKLRVFIKN